MIKKGRDDQAAVSLSRLTGLPADHPDVEADLIEIRANLEEEHAMGETSYLDCFRNTKNRMALRTWTGILIQAWQQLTGSTYTLGGVSCAC